MSNGQNRRRGERREARTQARVLVASLGILITIALLPLVTGLLGAAVLYVVFNRLHALLSVRTGERASALLTTIVAALLIVLPAIWLAMTIVVEGPGAVSSLQQGHLVSSLSSLRIGGLDAGAAMATASTQILSWLSGAFLQLMNGAFRATINLVIALFGLYFLLVAPPHTWARISRYLPFSANGVDMLRTRFYRVTEATLFGTALVAMLQGSIVGAGFALVGLPDAVLWGVITAIASVLPVLGSALVWFPAVVVLLVEGRLGAALAMVLLGAGVASNIDNVARLAVNRRVSGLHPMLTLVGAFAGVRLLGIAGVLLGPLALSYFFELARLYEEEHGSDAGADEQTGRVREIALSNH